MTRTLYEKIGRRYVPVSIDWYRDAHRDTMRVGTFRLMYAYSYGATRYEYDVTPATASWVAAATIARQAMESAIAQAAVACKAEDLRPYTKAQLAVIERFRAEMAAVGGLLPAYWEHTSARDLSEVAIKAVENYRP